MATPETSMTDSGPSATPATNGAAAPGNGTHGTPPERMSEEEFRQKNFRRVELIRKEGRQGLSPEEQGALRRLEEEVAAWVNARHPPPPVDTERLREVIRKAEAEAPAPNGA